ncbi:MAG: hypothetical protein N4A57_03215 [Anaeromicrobium sp.]|jgi:hypothetical protein|uniref:hypothetical protein n=1 Tax=Anaeromicrobium sp. TaxID=1929132 RepID=UPI0025F9A142|nr:hypothetical protein [Anaeromicrobium sp.]MCT4593270.1 hypothetical protein [Anaeromicrobium sp.]
MKSKLRKKIVWITLLVAVAVCGVTACGINKKEKNVVVLENQQKEIEHILAIKKIDNIGNFRGVRWLENGNILGIKNAYASFEDKEACNICIYDVKTGEFKNLSYNQDKGDIWLSVLDITKDERYLLYDKLMGFRSYDQRRNLYVIDLKTGEEKKIEDLASATTTFVDEEKIIAAKGMKLYTYDVDGNKTEIKLPEEMVEKMKDYSRFNFEEDLKQREMSNGGPFDEETIQGIKEDYQYHKNNNEIMVINKSGDEIYVGTYNRITFAYNLKTNDYKELTEEEAKKVYHHKKNTQNIVRVEKNHEGEEEIWELDENGTHKRLIAKGNFHGRRITVSPDHTKGVYCMKGRMGEKNLFVYDFETGKSIKIFPQIIGNAVWNPSSNKFFMRIPMPTKDKNTHYITSIVTLN